MRRRFWAPLFAIAACICLILGFVACGEKDSGGKDGKTTGGTEDKTSVTVRVVFHAEGGIFPAAEGEEPAEELAIEVVKGARITPPTPPVWENCVFLGWYLENGSEEFDVREPVTKSLELYAKWYVIVNCSYSIRYIDDEGVERTIVTYSDLQPGDPFFDFEKKAEEVNAYPGHTVERRLEDGKLVVNYYADMECTTLLDPETKHPGGEGDVDYPVYVKFLKGSYTYVYTPDSLNSAISGFSDNIILLADIDMAHQPSFKGIRAGTNFKKNIIGNNFSIKNATISLGTNDTQRGDLIVDSDLDSGLLLFVSLFGNLSNVTIEDLTVENLKVELDIINSLINHVYFAPVSVKAEGVTLKNVKVKGSFEIKKLPSDFAGHEDEKLHIVKDEAFYYQSEDTTVEGCEFDMTVTDSRAAANG